MLEREVPLVDEVLVSKIQDLLRPSVDVSAALLERLEVLEFHRLRQPLKIRPRLADLIRGKRGLRLLAESRKPVGYVALRRLLRQLVGASRGIEERLVLRESRLLVGLCCRQPRLATKLLRCQRRLEVRLSSGKAGTLIHLLRRQRLLGTEFLDAKSRSQILLTSLLDGGLVRQLRLEPRLLVRPSGLEHRLLVGELGLLTHLSASLSSGELLIGPQFLDAECGGEVLPVGLLLRRLVGKLGLKPRLLVGAGCFERRLLVCERRLLAEVGPELLRLEEGLKIRQTELLRVGLIRERRLLPAGRAKLRGLVGGFLVPGFG